MAWGSITVAITMPAPSIAGPKPNRAMAMTVRGTTTMAPKLAPISAMATLRPWCRSNHGEMVADRPVSDSVA